MSQGLSNLLGLARTAYVNALRYRRPALAVGVFATLGTLLFGPAGAPIGSAIGLFFSAYTEIIVASLLSGLIAYRNIPTVRQFVQQILKYLREKLGITYVRNQEMFY